MMRYKMASKKIGVRGRSNVITLKGFKNVFKNFVPRICIFRKYLFVMKKPRYEVSNFQSSNLGLLQCATIFTSQVDLKFN